eukprot:TRINITY_DN11588_c0_g1_i4.p2 TRINITY_DN11588_c0_g1~~TRINITY_DN11588_c0_g1_i4.p2  ORF type:complete len:412 (+),score=34.23 TRINITY_DN11588_c0_g1_i4:799-2034(+)
MKRRREATLWVILAAVLAFFALQSPEYDTRLRTKRQYARHLPLYPELRPSEEAALAQLHAQLLQDLTTLQSNQHQTKFLICQRPTWDCGFGCIMHGLVPCFVRGLALGRTVIIAQSASMELANYNISEFYNEPCILWNCLFKDYTFTGAREQAHLPSSDTISDLFCGERLPIMESLAQVEKAAQIYGGRRTIGEMFVYGVIVAWLLRPSPRLERFFEETAQQHLPHPWNYSYDVTMHIRGTDKIKEAALHSAEEYLMVAQHDPNKLQDHVYWQIPPLGRPFTPVAQPRQDADMFLATDDVDIFKRLVGTDASAYKVAGIPGDFGAGQSNRYGNNLHLPKLLLELNILARGKVFVGTFSSNGRSNSKKHGHRHEGRVCSALFLCRLQLRVECCSFICSWSFGSCADAWQRRV